MPSLFDPLKINRLVIANRVIRSATWEGMASRSGECSKRLISLYRELAIGEVGLIITGYAFVRRDGKKSPNMNGMNEDSLVNGWREATTEVHNFSSKIAMQLVHAGGAADPKMIAPARPKAPSAIKHPQYPSIPQELSLNDINDIIQAFIDAARRCKSAGFDAVQLHCAHGYLLSQFLSPALNKRNDDYGGSIDNRVRIIKRIVRRMRQELGRDYPVLIKLNGCDYIDGGLDEEEAVQAAMILEAAGVDAIEVSGGMDASGDQAASRIDVFDEEQEMYFLGHAQAIKRSVKIPVGVVGGIRSYSVAQNAIKHGLVDFVSLSRPLIREPHLIRDWREGIISKANCISCNNCLKIASRERGIYCYYQETSQ